MNKEKQKPVLNQLLLNGIISGSIYALIALGFAVIYKTVRFFHFAHGIVYTAGAYFAYSLSISLGINVILSFFLASAFSAILGIAIDRCIYLPLRKNNAPSTSISHRIVWCIHPYPKSASINLWGTDSYLKNGRNKRRTSNPWGCYNGYSNIDIGC